METPSNSSSSAAASNAGPKYLFQSTTTSTSEQQLAYSLGYPKSWHVIRIAPNPNITNITNISSSINTNNNKTNPEGAGTTCLDIIYAGNPHSGTPTPPDTYYNHNAALSAAMKWKEGKSLPTDQKGGQLLEPSTEFQRGDIVEALYQGSWYKAKIMKVKFFKDGIRYNIHYTVDKSSQTNVKPELLRIPNPFATTPTPPTTKTKTKTATSSSVKRKRESTPKKKPGRKKKKVGRPRKNPKPEDDDDDDEEEMETTLTPTTPSTPTSPKKRGRKYEPDPNALELASRMGLPLGWTARVRSNSRYTFRNPEGTQRFLSKKAVFAHLGLPLPVHGKRFDHVTNYDEEEDEEEEGVGEEGGLGLGLDGVVQGVTEKVAGVGGQGTNVQDEDDPPWRTTGHDYIGKRVSYKFTSPTNEEVVAMGTVMGYIADTDVDKDGEPGFVSETTGKPASLFHVKFDFNTGALSSQDLEEFELKEIFVDEEKDDGDDGEDDNVVES